MSCSSRNLAGVQKPVEKRSFIVNSYSCMAKKMGNTTANSSVSAINSRGTNNKIRDPPDKPLEIHKCLEKGTLLAEHLTDRWERTTALHRARQIIVTVMDVGSPGFFAVELNKIASISTEDALLLLAVSPPSDRMFHLDNKELLNEAKCIEVGQMVEAYHGETSIPSGRFGVVVSKGTVPEHGRGIYFGVKFAPEPTYSNSSFHRMRSVFEGNIDTIEYLTFQSLRIVKEQNNIGNKLASLSLSSKLHHQQVTSAGDKSKTGDNSHPLTLGERVVWISDNGPEAGVVRWLGMLPECGPDLMVGVEFENPVGSGTGFHNNQVLFDARSKHASLVPIVGLMKEKDFQPSSSSSGFPWSKQKKKKSHHTKNIISSVFHDKSSEKPQPTHPKTLDLKYAAVNKESHKQLLQELQLQVNLRDEPVSQVQQPPPPPLEKQPASRLLPEPQMTVPQETISGQHYHQSGSQVSAGTQVSMPPADTHQHQHQQQPEQKSWLPPVETSQQQQQHQQSVPPAQQPSVAPATTQAPTQNQYYSQSHVPSLLHQQTEKYHHHLPDLDISQTHQQQSRLQSSNPVTTTSAKRSTLEPLPQSHRSTQVLSHSTTIPVTEHEVSTSSLSSSTATTSTKAHPSPKLPREPLEQSLPVTTSTASIKLQQQNQHSRSGVGVSAPSPTPRRRLSSSSAQDIGTEQRTRSTRSSERSAQSESRIPVESIDDFTPSAKLYSTVTAKGRGKQNKIPSESSSDILKTSGRYSNAAGNSNSTYSGSKKEPVTSISDAQRRNYSNGYISPDVTDYYHVTHDDCLPNSSPTIVTTEQLRTSIEYDGFVVAPDPVTVKHSSSSYPKLGAGNDNEAFERSDDTHSHDFEVGSVVEVLIHNEPCYGVIRWIGHPDGNRHSKKVAGIEMEEDIGGNDGSFDGKHFFTCPPGKGMYMFLHVCRKDSRFLDSLQSNLKENRGLSATFGSIDCPAVTGDIPPLTLCKQTMALFGKNRGIQGHHNSCYLDATLFSMFTFSTVFDSVLHRPQTSTDIREYHDVQRVLKEEIVNPLRQNMYVRADRVMKLRMLLETLSSVSGLTCEEKDPEEFLNSLLHQILKAEPFLKLSSGQESYFYQLFVEKNESLRIPTVQQLFDQSFLTSDIKLKEVPACLIIQMPRFGKQFKMYNRIFPSPVLDITDVLDDSPRQCHVCGNLAEYECRECFYLFNKEFTVKSFCSTCVGRVHSHKERASHSPRKISVPDEFRTLSATVIPRIYMDLFAVVCIETSHYVAFVKCGNSHDSPWCFFDSMADRKGEQNGYNIPEVVLCPEVSSWLSEDGPTELLNEPDKQLPERAKRLFGDAYMCMYQSSSVMMYR